jgi:hypothetical protein
MMFARGRLILALLLVGFVGAGGSAAKIGSGAPAQAWTEVRWPFLLDEWGVGQAFRCEHPDCGPGTRLFVRVKRGFCNCVDGVADDAEVDRLTDFEFLGGPTRPLGPGRPIRLGDMAGRARSFAVDSAEAPSRRVDSVVVANRCDALVATFIADGPVSVSVSNIADLLPRTVLANLP